MKAMILAAGLGTRLRPLTYELPKPMVPVLDRPVMAHIVDLLEHHGLKEAMANLHYFPDSIRDYFGDRLTYSYEEVLVGTAGGVRNCADFLDSHSFLVISGDALTDIDLTEMRARHEATGGVATLAVKRVQDTSQFGVVLHDEEGRINGFQEKPDPAEALSNLANCGIYMFRPEIFEYFPDTPFADWAQDIFPVLLEHDVPFYIHEFDGYWNDIGSLWELRQGTFDALSGAIQLDRPGTEVQEGVFVGNGASLDQIQTVEPPIWIGQNVKLGDDVRLEGPLVIGDGAVIGDDTALRESIIFPGSKVNAKSILISGIAANRGIVGNMRKF